MVNIIDVGSGNIKSIQNWIERLNIPTKTITKPKQIDSHFLILPGVGSAGPYMQRLKNSSFDKAIIEHANYGKKVVGICLGFQIMGKYSEEDGGTEGLHLIDGYTEHLHNGISHNGWESFFLNTNHLNRQSFNSKLKLTKKKIVDGRVFYNHEYGFVNHTDMFFNKPISKEFSKYSSIIIQNNIIGIQFHPEKSQTTGLELIKMIL